jgi:hypothetical protein
MQQLLDRLERPRALWNALKFSIRTDKDTYRAGDKVDLHYEFTNKGKTPLYVSDGFLSPEHHETGPGRHFELRAFADRDVPLVFWSEQLTEGNAAGVRKVYKVAAGEAHKGTISLSSGSFENQLTRKRHVLGKDAGRYRLALQHVVGDNFGILDPPKGFDENLLWQGRLLSNEVEIHFKE